MRILIADHRKECADLLRRKHYEVDFVSNGKDALEYLQSASYDAAILNTTLGGPKGLALLARLRAQGCETPVIIVSPRGDPYEKIACLDNGADDYLGEPFPMEELFAQLRALTRRHSSQHSSLLCLGNICLDRTSFELSSPHGSLCLRKKEFQMMEMLLLNPCSVIPLDQFILNIWGGNSEAEDHVVWVCISNLRRRLKELKADVVIKVKRNIGYSLHAKK